jgi:hypothetical protein
MDSKTIGAVVSLLVVSVVTLALMRMTVPSSRTEESTSSAVTSSNPLEEPTEPKVSPNDPLLTRDEVPIESDALLDTVPLDSPHEDDVPPVQDEIPLESHDSLVAAPLDSYVSSSEEVEKPPETDPFAILEEAIGSDTDTALSLSTSALSSLQGQVSEEDLAQAFELLGRMLGLPEVGPQELKRKVEDVGKLRFLRPVPIDFMARDELVRYIQELFEDEYSVEVAKREERALRALGFLMPGQDLRSIRFRVLNENIAGFYDERPQVKKLFAISSGQKLNLMNQLVLSHELRHAIQDQHLNLRQVFGTLSDYDDRRLAALSLIEGDATLLMEKYMSSGGGQTGTGLEGLLGGSGAEAMDGRSMAEMFAGPELRSAPPVVREQLIVPYMEGRKLASEIHRRGGFNLLNEYLERLPQSMEQVLHPEKYLDRVDEPIEVSLIDASGKVPEFEGTVGESFLRVLFESTLSQEDGHRAAAGWGGDRYVVWRDTDSRFGLLWRTAWDSDRDASEFFEALTRFGSIRFGRGPTPPTDSGRLELEGNDGSRSVLSRRGREVTLRREGFQ